MSYVTWRLRAYIHKALLDALVLTVEELRKTHLIVKNKATETPQGCSIILRFHYHNVCDSVGVLYMHQRGAFVVARFDNQGNAKAFLQWNE